MSKHLLQSGTDIANMVIFAPENPLHDLALKNTSDYEKMESETLLHLPMGADGEYLLHVYLEEEIPPRVFKYCRSDESSKHTQMFLEHGRLAFDGIEYILPERYEKRVANELSLPPGRYQVDVYKTDFPEEVYEKALDEVERQLNPEQRLRYEKYSQKSIIILSVFFITLLLLLFTYLLPCASAFFKGRTPPSFTLSTFIMLILCLGSYLIIFIESKKKMPEAFEDIQEKQKAVDKDFPDLVATLKRLP